MSVLVPSLPSTHPHHQSHSSLFSTMNSTNPRRHHGPISTKSTENDPDSDHVPFGVVNSMKQRFLNKMNESFAFHPPPPPSSSSSSSHHSSTLTRTSLSKPSSRQPSNENLLQNKSITSPLKRTTRLSRSQDNLSNHHAPMVNEQFTSYLQPKQDLIIVDTSTSQENELFDGQKTALHRQSYTELHCDEAPKPGTVTTVKNMFERQIRLSRYDADKLLSNPPVSNGRSNCQHRDFPSPTRSRSMSPNDLAVRQRRTNLSNSTSSSTGLSLPVPTSYPDLVISHTPPTETSKPTVSHEPTYLNGHSTDFHSTATMISKEKKSLGSMRNSLIHEPPQPLTVIVDEHLPLPSTSSARPNLLLPSTVPSSESIDCQPLDFKSRLALFNRTNTQLNGEKKTPIVAATPSVTKPSVPHSNRPTIEEKKEPLVEPMNHHLLTMGIARSVVNTAKAVTFFGGSKLNSNQKSSLPNSIAPPPPPPAPSTTSSSTSQANPTDVFRAPDIIGGNIKLNKSSIYSGSKKDARVQFIENVDTFEYPSFEVAMAELGGVVSDEEKNGGNEDDDDDDGSTGSSTHEEEEMQLKSLLQEKLNQLSQSLEDVDDDELERLARINAKYNANDKSALKPKGTLHTFRPTHLDQYELGTQHNSLSNGKSSDKTSSPANAYSILARQKLLQTSDNSVKNFSHHPMVKTNGHSSVKSTYDLPNTNPSTIQWSSMSTTTDLLF